jgi:hypothetical protein
VPGISDGVGNAAAGCRPAPIIPERLDTGLEILAARGTFLGPPAWHEGRDRRRAGGAARGRCLTARAASGDWPAVSMRAGRP